jgi:hypothetical protein
MLHFPSRQRTASASRDAGNLAPEERDESSAQRKTSRALIDTSRESECANYKGVFEAAPFSVGSCGELMRTSTRASVSTIRCRVLAD